MGASSRSWARGLWACGLWACGPSAWAVGCSGAEPEEPLADVGLDCKTTAGVVAKVFSPRCGASGCHSASDAPDLVSSGFESKLVGVRSPVCGEVSIVPGAPDESLLYRKLTDGKPACGNPMPLGGKALPPDELACVRDWIAAMPSVDAGPTDATSDVAVDASVEDDATLDGALEAGKDATTDVGKDATTTDAAKDASAVDAAKDAAPDAVVDSGPKDAAGDSAGDAAGCGAIVSYAAQVQPIWNASCTSATCHGGSSAATTLVLTSAKSWAALVNVKSGPAACSGKVLVVPSNVASSYLVNKLTGTGMCAGTQMPKGGAALSTAQVDAVRAWICRGAKND